MFGAFSTPEPICVGLPRCVSSGAVIAPFFDGVHGDSSTPSQCKTDSRGRVLKVNTVLLTTIPRIQLPAWRYSRRLQVSGGTDYFAPGEYTMSTIADRDAIVEGNELKIVNGEADEDGEFFLVSGDGDTFPFDLSQLHEMIHLLHAFHDQFHQH